MAEQPKYFDIEDTETGKRYRIETDDPKATYDEAVEYFSGLPEADWAQYEYKPQAITTPAPEVAAQPAAPVATPPAVAAPPAAPSPLVGTGFAEEYSVAFRDSPQVAQMAEGLWQAGVRDPSVFNQKIGEMLGDSSYQGITSASISQLKDRDAFYRKRGLKNPGNFIAREATGEVEPEAPTGIVDTLFNAVARGTGQVYNSGVGLTALGADVVGADDTADSLLDQFIQNNAKMAMHYQRPVNSYKDVDSFGTAGLYALDTLGELAPQLVGSLGAGYVGKEAAKKIVAKSVDDFVEQQVASGVAREAAEAVGKQAVEKIAMKGAIIGTSLNSVGQESGSIFGETYMQTGEKAPGLSLAAGVFAGSLDAILPATVLRNLSAPAIERKILNRLAKESSKGFALEGSTEAMQEFVAQLPTSVITGESPFTEEMLDRMIEAGIRGGFGGYVVSGGVSVVTSTPDSPALRYTGEPIVVPTARKGTKLYREQLVAAQESIIGQVNQLTGVWTNAPKIEVHENFEKLDGVDDGAIGVYTTETLPDGSTVPVIKLNTEAIIKRAKQRDISPESVVEAVTFHEALAHHGLTSLFRNDLDEFLDDIYTNGSEQFRDKVDEWMQKNPRAYESYAPQSRRILATEEVMAEWSEGGPLARTFYDSVANYIKDFARTRLRMNLKYTQREVKAFLAVAHERTMSGTKIGATPSAPRNMNDLPEGVPGNVTDLGERKLNLLRELRNKAQLSPKEVSDAVDFLDEYYNQNPTQEVADLIDHFDKLEEQYFDSRTIYNDNVPETPLERAEREAIKADDDYANLAFYSDDPRQDMDRRTKARREYDAEVERLDQIREEKSRIYQEELAKAKNTPKYMRGDDPIDPDELTADDLIEAQNALDILNRLNYAPKVVTPDQLEAEAIARNLPPSDITRLVGMEPGKLMKKLFLYDVAATKLSDRAAKIKADIDANGLTPERQAAYIETTMTLNDLTSRIFDFQAEIGRTLAANRRVNFSRKRVRDLKSVLEKYGVEALADPETFMKYMAEMEAKSAKKEGNAQFGTGFAQYVNIPRAIMSSADLSAPLRQGIVFIGYKEYWKSFAKMFSMLGKSGENNYNFLMKKIARDPNYELMLKARLQFSSLDGELTLREEDFQTELARKIPLYGRVVKVSEQAYAGFLNKLRADMFNRFVKEYQDAGIELDEDLLKGLGRFINAGTGRAELPDFLKPSSTILNATFFSARLMHSRVQMLNPAFYAKLPGDVFTKGPSVKKAALLSMLKFGGIALLVNGALNALFPEVETEVDPRSSDFMKVKVGNTRFDLGGGFNQYLILGARTGTWLYNQSLGFVERNSGVDMTDYKVANKKTVGGDYRDFGAEGMTQDTYGSVLADFFRSKLSPQASYVVDFLNEEDYIGRPFTVEGSLASRLVPMTASSVYEAYTEDSPVPMPVIFTATLFGVGTNTYTAPGLDPKRELEAPVTFNMSDLEDGQNDFIRAEGGVVTLKKPARDAWTATLNNYYPVFIQEVSGEMGMQFEEMDDEMKKATVKEALKRTRAAAKKDMMYELGLE